MKSYTDVELKKAKTEIEQKRLDDEQFQFPDDKLGLMDIDYMNSLDSYLLKKRYMEHFCALVGLVKHPISS